LDNEVIQQKLKVSNELGLHARVATMIVQKMQKYTCTVTLVLHEVEVSARSVLGLLLLAAAPGTEVVVKAKGPGAREAIEDIRRLIQDEQPELN